MAFELSKHIWTKSYRKQSI